MRPRPSDTPPDYTGPVPRRNPLILAAFAATTLLSTWLALGPASPDFGGLEAKAARFAAVLLILLESLPVLACVWLGAAGLGWPLQRVLKPTGPAAWVLQIALGLGTLLLAWWLLAWVGFLSPVTAWGVPAVGILFLLAQAFSDRFADPAPSSALPLQLPPALLLAAPALGLLLAAAAAPPGTLWRVEALAYDVTSYHLQIPREWLAAGGMIPLRHNVYSFLPGLIESAYASLGAMRGGTIHAVYASQLFHASLAVFAAVTIGAAVLQLTSTRAAIAAAAAFLSIPWVLVTGSLAYNEMATLAFAAAALALVLDPRGVTPRTAAAVGFLLGTAALAKPTAGPMLAVPLGLVLLIRLLPDYRRALAAAGVAAAAGLLTLTPYFARNYAWTGNPVFPFATATLGTGHWDDELADRWDRGHGLSWSGEPRLEALDRQFLRNAGYGALGGHATPRETRNVARFTREGGVPVFWLAVALAAALTLRSPPLRREAGTMLVVVLLQLTFWLLATHLQSRFLVATLLPACVILGLGVHAVPIARAAHVAATIVVLLLYLGSQLVLVTQTRPFPTERGAVAAPLYAWIDTLDTVARHPLDDLPAGPRGAHAYLVADTMGLLYIDTPFTYHTAFDESLLGDILRETGGDPARVTASFRSRGITHVWTHWSELARLHATYGFDDAVTETTLRAIAADWRIVEDHPGVTLYALP